MWIKVLDSTVWVNMKHVTYFSVQTERFVRGSVLTSIYVAYTYLNTSSLRSNYNFDDIVRGKRHPEKTEVEDQARIPVCRGSEKKCEQFVKDKSFLQSAYEWLGYFVAGRAVLSSHLSFKTCTPNFFEKPF